MDMLSVVLIAFCGVLVLSVVFLFSALERGRRKAEHHLEQKSVAVTEREQLERQLAAVTAERDKYLAEKDTAKRLQAEAEKKAALAEQRSTDMEKHVRDWEAKGEEIKKTNQAQLLETLSKASTKLIEDHKRESEASKKESAEQIKKTTEELAEKFLSVTKAVASIQERQQDVGQKFDLLHKAISSPGGAGHLAEVGLENTLKKLGLVAMRDFVMQYSIEDDDGTSLRPDAVIFLPQDIVMVIDCKASKFFVELAEVEGTPREAEVKDKLIKRMQEHIRTLANKQYASVVQNTYKKAGKGGAIRKAFYIMALPSESAIERMKQLDDGFLDRVESAGLILVGPASLTGFCQLASHSIDKAQQIDNHEKILNTVQELLDRVITALSYAERMGKGIKSAAENFRSFSASVNSMLLPKMRQLGDFSVKPAKAKELPKPLQSFEIHSSHDPLLIEGEAVSETGDISEKIVSITGKAN